MHNAQMRPNPQQARNAAGRAALPARLTHLVLNWLAFGLCYPLANGLAAQQQVRRSLALAWDAYIPFLAWMIVPYATSGLFFTLVFFLVRTAEQLRVASRRLLTATVLGTLVFALFPARFSLTRSVPDGALALLYGGLDLVDQPYNQFPSLHVAYCVIFWLTLAPLVRSGLRAVLGTWLVLIIASTVLTWQHHVVDVAGGLALGLLAVALVRAGRTRRHTVACFLGGGSRGGGVGRGGGGPTRLVDEFEVDTRAGEGTAIAVVKWKR
jgi:membrane-associated phospholipid phosphatase